MRSRTHSHFFPRCLGAVLLGVMLAASRGLAQEVPSQQRVAGDIVYKGARWLEQDELDQVTGLKKGQPLDAVRVKLACEAVVRRYAEDGWLFASCQLVANGKAKDTQTVFEIVEGLQVRLRQIRFTGNHVVADSALRTKINSSAGHGRIQVGIAVGSDMPLALRFKVGTFPYIPAVAENDVDRLRGYYREVGFHDAQVSLEVEWSLDSRSVALIFHINEGLRYRLKAPPDIAGTSAVSRKVLESFIQLRAGDFYDQEKIDRELCAIKDCIGYTGRQACVLDQVVFSGPGECVVHYEIEEKPPVRVGRILVRGNTRTPTQVILSHVHLRQGQLLAYPELRKGERNLLRTNLFESDPERGIRPTVSVVDSYDEKPVKDILVEVQEKSSLLDSCDLRLLLNWCASSRLSPVGKVWGTVSRALCAERVPKTVSN